MVFPIIDLHCDLLSYLAGHPLRTPEDLKARCAISQLHKGCVKLQILAVFTETSPQSIQKAKHQVSLYQNLPLSYPKDFVHYSPSWNLQSPSVATLIAFENASAFCREDEPLSECFKRLNAFIKNVNKPLYISLTWNQENRFGGGALTRVGLKEDGKQLLEELYQKQIAIDLSHASDALAYDVIDHMEAHHLEIPLIASHSNARAVTSVARNLSDEIAKEIFRRGGVVGLNLYHYFIGESVDFLPKHLAHWLELGGEHGIALGADFFYEIDLPPKNGSAPFYLTDYQDASCYGRLLDFLKYELKLTSSLLEKLAYKNALTLIQKLDL